MFVRRSVGLMVAVLILVLGISGAAAATTLPPDPTQRFVDVGTGAPYADAVEALAEAGIVEGYGDGRFGLMSPVLRQQFTKMIVKTLDLSAPDLLVPNFVDVDIEGSDSSGYPFRYIALCWMAKIVLGKDETHFAPYENVTRQQLVTMAVRSVKSLLETPPDDWTGTFPASDPTHGENIRLAEYNGLLENVTFGRPFNWRGLEVPASRGECAGVLFNVRSLVQDSVK